MLLDQVPESTCWGVCVLPDSDGWWVVLHHEGQTYTLRTEPGADLLDVLDYGNNSLFDLSQGHVPWTWADNMVAVREDRRAALREDLAAPAGAVSRPRRGDSVTAERHTFAARRYPAALARTHALRIELLPTATGDQWTGCILPDGERWEVVAGDGVTGTYTLFTEPGADLADVVAYAEYALAAARQGRQPAAYRQWADETHRPTETCVFCGSLHSTGRGACRDCLRIADDLELRAEQRFDELADGMTTKPHHFDAADVKEAARGRWPDVLASLAPELRDAIDAGHRKHVTCVRHGGKDGLRVLPDFAESGGVVVQYLRCRSPTASRPCSG